MGKKVTIQHLDLLNENGFLPWLPLYTSHFGRSTAKNERVVSSAPSGCLLIWMRHGNDPNQVDKKKRKGQAKQRMKEAAE